MGPVALQSTLCQLMSNVMHFEPMYPVTEGSRSYGLVTSCESDLYKLLPVHLMGQA